MATLGTLDGQGLVDLAEVRWRTGDLNRAGEAATAALRAEIDDPVALVIAAEAASSVGRPGEARRFAQRAMATAAGSIDAIFAGMPRSTVWPPDADEPPPTAPTLFDRGPEIAPAPAEPGPPDAGADAATAAKAPTGPMTLGFWDEEDVVDPGPIGLPDPAAELAAGRAALVAGALDEAALHLGLALRLAPALAPAVLEATAGARGPAVAIVRGDAYRIAGHEDEARNAYADAARGGPPERRKRARTKPSKPAAAVASRRRRRRGAPMRPTRPARPPMTQALRDALGERSRSMRLRATRPASPRTTSSMRAPPTATMRRRRPTRMVTRSPDPRPLSDTIPDPTRPAPKEDMPGTERTLVLIKPDGVQRQLVGRILARYEDRGLRLVGLKLVHVDRDLAERHYAAHRAKPFFAGLVEFIISAPLVAVAVDGPNAIAVVRAINGATRPHEAAPGTIRGDFALETAQNIVHASDSPEAAAAELALWFSPDQLLDYERDIDRWVLAPND